MYVQTEYGLVKFKDATFVRKKKVEDTYDVVAYIVEEIGPDDVRQHDTGYKLAEQLSSEAADHIVSLLEQSGRRYINLAEEVKKVRGW